jgi:hypothetical protein
MALASLASPGPDVPDLLLYLSTLAVIWLTGTVVYRLRFHPLAHIPGPKLAAITNLYGLYYSVVGGSRFYIQIERLHERYGTESIAGLIHCQL